MTKTIGTSALIDVWASAGERLTPDDAKIAAGWQRSETPAAEWMNERHHVVESKLNHLLKNGIAEWDEDTDYDAGDLAKRGGVVYVALVPTTGAEPPYPDWQALATGEGLLQLRAFTVTELGTFVATGRDAQMVYVSDGTGNKRIAVSDGTNWRFPDGSVVS